MKQKTITVSFPHLLMGPKVDPRTLPEKDRQSYRVVKVTDSIEYSPRQELTRLQVKELCEAGGWKVIVVASS